MASFSFWMTTAGLPAGQIISAKLIRWYNKIKQTSTTDILNISTYIDAIVVLNPEPFRPYVNPLINGENFSTVFLTLSGISGLCWAFCLFGYEKSLNEWIEGDRTFPYGSCAFAWLACAFIIFGNAALFLGKVIPWITQ